MYDANQESNPRPHGQETNSLITFYRPLISQQSLVRDSVFSTKSST